MKKTLVVINQLKEQGIISDYVETGDGSQYLNKFFRLLLRSYQRKRGQVLKFDIFGMGAEREKRRLFRR